MGKFPGACSVRVRKYGKCLPSFFTVVKLGGAEETKASMEIIFEEPAAPSVCLTSASQN
jgi:hypothetical protein